MRTKKEKIINFLSKALFLTAEHAFFASLVLFLLALAFGFFLFYQFSIIANMEKFNDLEEPFSLKRKTYEEVLNSWKADENRFIGSDSKEYKNPFRAGKELTD